MATTTTELVVAGDRYRVIGRIGSGGMADVYRARDELLGRDVALKVFRRELATEEDLRRQQSEIRLLATLSHPSLVTLFDAVPGPDGRGVLVLEFVDGPDLGSRRGAGLEPATSRPPTSCCRPPSTPASGRSSPTSGSRASSMTRSSRRPAPSSAPRGT